MSEEVTIFDTMRIISLWTGPAIMVVGSLLLLLKSNAYNNLENKLKKEVGGIKKRIIPQLENNINFLHNWMLAHKNTTGLIFIICSLIILFFLKK